MLKVTETVKKRTALGQGLDALIPSGQAGRAKFAGSRIKYLSIDSLLPIPHQPRRSFREESLADLSQFNKRNGRNSAFDSTL